MISIRSQKPDDDLSVDVKARDFIKDNQKSLDLPSFFETVRTFYSNSCKYMIQKYPFNDNFLINARVLNITNRCQHKLKEIVYFVNRFKIVEDAALDNLEEEFIQYLTDAEVANI